VVEGPEQFVAVTWTIAFGVKLRPSTITRPLRPSLNDTQLTLMAGGIAHTPSLLQKPEQHDTDPR
jgi:hypothetical protein